MQSHPWALMVFQSTFRLSPPLTTAPDPTSHAVGQIPCDSLWLSTVSGISPNAGPQARPRPVLLSASCMFLLKGSLVRAPSRAEWGPWHPSGSWALHMGLFGPWLPLQMGALWHHRSAEGPASEQQLRALVWGKEASQTTCPSPDSVYPLWSGENRVLRTRV